MLHEESQITVVDYSETDMEMHDFDNAGLVDFIQKKQEDWIKCRWINVNGLSWDVIQALGKNKNLHRLAIEDLVNTDNRTKVDWLVFYEHPR
jgi:Mg2+ and Co2+ transporter CorA